MKRIVLAALAVREVEPADVLVRDEVGGLGLLRVDRLQDVEDRLGVGEAALRGQVLHERDDVEPESGGEERRAAPGEQLHVSDVHAANRILARSGNRANRACRSCNLFSLTSDKSTFMDFTDL